ncbi:MAG: ATP-binding protein [Bacillota bacterium]|nr:ATP-binding protein [Bacillota bacterium]
MVKRTFNASVDSLAEAQAFLEKELENLDCPFPFILKFSLAFEEVFVNVAHYAYPNKEGEVIVQMDYQNGMVIVSLIDQGIPFNPLEKKDPDTSLALEEREIGGLGILMVKKSMDEVHYEYKDNSNIFTMKKKI